MEAEERKRGPKGFILLEPGNIMQILPEDNKSWLTLFYSLPEELISKRPAYQKRQGRNTPNAEPENPYGWNSSTIVHILERREYTGCVVNFKTYTNSIWDKKQRDNPSAKGNRSTGNTDSKH